MKRLALLLPLLLAGCGDDDVRAELDLCKVTIRAELANLLEHTRRQAEKSMATLEGETEITHESARKATDPKVKLSNEKIKAVADLFARMAESMIEAQLAVLEPTAADVAKCKEILSDARRR
ncbi:MAG TPA: hypothetical protein VFY92_04495 [Hyphomicrobiaceae bacterium]|nr:hypothetical protein [Hyphomicrobiaceae bacterium]